MEKEYLEQLIERADKKRRKKKVLKQDNQKKLFSYLALKRVKAAVIALVVLGCIAAFHILGYDIDIDCEKANDTCVISKSSLVDPVPYKIARFDSGGILDVFVKSRVIEDGSTIYDLLLDYGEARGQVFIDYGFNTVIKANTAKMKLTNYLGNSTIIFASNSLKALDFKISLWFYFN